MAHSLIWSTVWALKFSKENQHGEKILCVLIPIETRFSIATQHTANCLIYNRDNPTQVTFSEQCHVSCLYYDALGGRPVSFINTTAVAPFLQLEAICFKQLPHTWAWDTSAGWEPLRNCPESDGGAGGAALCSAKLDLQPCSNAIFHIEQQEGGTRLSLITHTPGSMSFYCLYVKCGLNVSKLATSK